MCWSEIYLRPVSILSCLKMAFCILHGEMTKVPEILHRNFKRAAENSHVWISITDYSAANCEISPKEWRFFVRWSFVTMWWCALEVSSQELSQTYPRSIFSMIFSTDVWMDIYYWYCRQYLLRPVQCNEVALEGRVVFRDNSQKGKKPRKIFSRNAVPSRGIFSNPFAEMVGV